MDDIQRWDFFGEVGINEPVRYLHLEAVKGRYVTYADHLAALAVAEKKGYHVGYKSAAGEFLTPESLAVTGMDDPRYAKGHADAVAECLVSDRERMEAQVAAYDRGRADERERIQSEALDAITMHVLTGEDHAAFLYRLDRILNPEWKP